MEWSFLKNNYELKNEGIYELLRNEIITNNIKPGTVLNERQIAHELGCSRTPIREALQRLENDGLIKKYPRQGSIVTELTLKDIIEIFQIREFIEPPSAALAAELIDDEDRIKLHEIIKDFNSLMSQTPSKDVYLKHNMNDIFVHTFIIRKTNNSRLIKITSEINNITQRISYLGTPVRFNESTDEHQKIIKALLNKDPKQAEETMRLHLLASKKRLTELIQSY